MVFAFAGLSTMTSFFAMARDTLASAWDTPLRAAEAQSRLRPPGGRELAGPLRALSPARHGQGARAGGRLRAGCEPQFELRPLAARPAAVPATVPPLHGQVRALLDAAEADRDGSRRVPGPTRRTGHRRARDGDAPLPRGSHRRHVPGGDAAEEGDAEAVRGPRPHRRRPDRARCGGPPRAGRDRPHRPAPPAPAPPGPPLPAGPPRRPV